MGSTRRKPILIAGAGLASLLHAQALKRAGIPFIVFERDDSIVFRAQGYRLRLSDAGLDAIESALGPEKFKHFWDVCGKTGGGGMTHLDAITGSKVEEGFEALPKDFEKKGQPLDLGSRDGKVVGVARGEARALFHAGIESSVRWSHHVTGYELSPSGVHAMFADGSKSEEGEMLIGGEGVHSEVAKQLSQGKLKTYDTGARGVHGQVPGTAFKGLGEGVWRISDTTTRPNTKVFLITNVRPGAEDDPDLSLGWTMGGQPGAITAPGDNYAVIGKPAADIAKSLTAKWHPKLKPLFDQMNEHEAAFWKISCSNPNGVPEWQNEPRVTVIGDAVHAMTPAGGMGANTAMRDSALLGRLLTEAGGYAEGVTAAYEKEMRVYASETVKASYAMASKQFGITIDENSPTV